MSTVMGKIEAGFTYIFTNPWFLLLGVPILAALIAICLRGASRPGKKFKLAREDYLIGFDLGVVALLTMLAIAAKAAKALQSLRAQLGDGGEELSPAEIKSIAVQIQESVTYLVSAPLLMVLFALLLFAISRVVAKNGWRGNPAELGTKWILGVDAIGLFLLCATLLMTGEVK